MRVRPAPAALLALCLLQTPSFAQAKPARRLVRAGRLLDGSDAQARVSGSIFRRDP